MNNNGKNIMKDMNLIYVSPTVSFIGDYADAVPAMAAAAGLAARMAANTTDVQTFVAEKVADAVSAVTSSIRGS